MAMSINEQVEIYKKSINDNSLSSTYKFILSYINKLEKEFRDRMSGLFKTGSVLNGYLDYSYFYFSNDFLSERKLKLGVVYNHLENRFELWLMGSIKKTQIEYWEKLKDTDWNKEKTMPQWYVISVELIATPNFEDLDEITNIIIEKVPLIYSDLKKDL